MKSTIKRILLLAAILILTMGLLTACGDETEILDESAPAVEENTEQEPLPEPADGQPEPTEDTSTENTNPASPEGGLVSDLGFRPEQNGFLFPNYGGEPGIQNLTAAELHRMFGDQACARIDGDTCVLTPPGEQWMEQINGAMSGGHCEGMAALSLLMYTGQISSDAFGASPVAAGLQIDDENLQREIAYWWATQVVTPTQTGVLKGTPNDILETLKQMQPGGETYTIGIYKRDGSGGHAITPFAVEDMGGGIFDVQVYDNNYPNETRRLKIDSNLNTWAYEASINPDVEPDLYEGDADTQTLDLTPTSARLPQQACSFCSDGGSAKGGYGLAAAAQQYNEIYLDGEGHLLISDDQDRKLGFSDGKLVSEIPGASYTAMKMGANTDYQEPIYRVPGDMNITAVIDGSTLTEESWTDLVMIGSGYTFGIEGIALSPDQMDTVIFEPADELISYDTDSSESPNIVVGIEQPGNADFYFEVQGADMEGGGTLTVLLDTKNSNLLINTEKLSNEGLFSLILTRITDEVEESFTAEDIALKAGALVYIEYGKWEGNGKGLYLGIDTNGDGTIDDEYEVVDVE